MPGFLAFVSLVFVNSFIINLIRKALDDAEAAQTDGETASESSDEETGDEPVPG